MGAAIRTCGRCGDGGTRWPRCFGCLNLLLDQPRKQEETTCSRQTLSSQSHRGALGSALWEQKTMGGMAGRMGTETRAAVQQGAGPRPRCSSRGANEKLQPAAPGGTRGRTAHAPGRGGWKYLVLRHGMVHGPAAHTGREETVPPRHCPALGPPAGDLRRWQAPGFVPKRHPREPCLLLLHMVVSEKISGFGEKGICWATGCAFGSVGPREGEVCSWGAG